ncbi:hypothetical protein L7F22_041371 [Adiantum nelumboides]|nr:hypothetical protein [Adiantum nelumboides]
MANMAFPTFHGRSDEDATDIMDNLEVACVVFGRDDDVSRLRRFPLLLKAEAKTWFNTLLPAVRADWGGLRMAFMQRFGARETSEKLCNISHWGKGTGLPEKGLLCGWLMPASQGQGEGKVPITFEAAREVAPLKERKLRYQLQHREVDQEEDGGARPPPGNVAPPHRGPGVVDQQDLLSRITSKLEDLSVHLIRAPAPLEQGRGIKEGNRKTTTAIIAVRRDIKCKVEDVAGPSARTAAARCTVTPHIRSAKSAKQAWDILAILYASRNEAKIALLRKELESKIMNEEDDMDIFLASVKDVNEQLISVGEVISASSLVQIVLDALLDSYQTYINMLGLCMEYRILCQHDSTLTIAM